MTTLRHPLGQPAAPPRVQPLWNRYWLETQRPLYSLLFLFPLVAIYEFGTLILRPVAGGETQLVAHSLIQRLLGWFGASGSWLPAVVLVLSLLAWQMVGAYPWRIRGWVLPLMAVESVILTAPLLVLGQLAMAAGPTTAGTRQLEQMVLFLGAGVYEELVFRLYLISGLTAVFVNVLRAPRRAGRGLVVLLSAALFAACHFEPIGSEPLVWSHFAARALAGCYLGLIFVRRGLGITAGCHAAFNVILLVLR